MSHATADLYDEHGEALQSLSMQMRSFGARRAFDGPIRTVRCHEDNALVKQMLAAPGDGAVLVVDGGGSMRSALMGDLIAASAVANGWSGAVIFGAVRDSTTIDTLDLGVKARGTNPRKSAKDGVGEVDVRLEVDDVVFRVGAHLYSDEDGILVER